MIPFVNIHTHHTNQVNSDIGIVDAHLITDELLTSLHTYSVGIHPCLIDEQRINEQLQHFYQRASLPNCAAIGECGLDRLQESSMMVQINIFEAQIIQAIALKKPVIVHCVRAFDVLIPLLKKYTQQIPFIIHGFNSNQNIAAQLLRNGAYLSFGAALINPKNERLRQVFELTPVDRIFLENDAAGIDIKQLYALAAEIKKCELHVMKEIIFANYKKVFVYE